MPHSRALKPGTMVAGDWRIERMLGQGGFGVTYEAHHRSSGSHVALKEYMPSGLCTRIEGSTRVTPAQGPAADVFKRGLAGFMKEADTLARLDHPSIVRVSGFFEANDTAYMALAYETGGTLANWLSSLDRAPTQAELDGLLRPLIDALVQVHSLPLLHRDIKPENIMLRDDGTPVLIDFGAVKNLVSSDSRSIHGPATLNFVTDGYAPPEQYVSEGDRLLGPWSDVYALGATLYEAVTKAKPASATRRMVEESHRPLTEMQDDKLGSGWRREFLEGIDKALSLKRSDRPQSMVEFRRAIGLIEAPRTKQKEQLQKTDAIPSPSSRQESTLVGAGPVSAEPALSVAFSRVTGVAKPAATSSVRTGIALAAGLLAMMMVIGWWWAVGWGGRPEHPASVVAVTKPQRQSDPVAALVPGSKQSARDVLVDGRTCSFCPEMVVVPAGQFTMGSPESEPEREIGEQQVPVTIARPFAAGKFAVTFDEWGACVADGGCNNYRPGDANPGSGTRPVIDVNWLDAKAYVAWLSGKTGKAYRLLSEAEREYVARAGTTTPFWWGTSIMSTQANYVGDEVYKGGGKKGVWRKALMPVGSFAANPWGLYQVHGNVNEWTEDCWNSGNSGHPGTGQARAVGDCGHHVARGGSYVSRPRDLRSSQRFRHSTDKRVGFLGFRLARTLDH